MPAGLFPTPTGPFTFLRALCPVVDLLIDDCYIESYRPLTLSSFSFNIAQHLVSQNRSLLTKRRKKTFFLLKGPFLGAFRYPIIAPTSWFLYFLSLTSWSIPNIEFKLLWPILVPKFFRNYQKMAIFDMFPFYHVTSNSHISAIFCKYGMKFFGEPLEMLYQKNRI